jgi:hypothetical protein
VYPVRRRDLFRQHRLEHAERLAELHGAALELTQDTEELLRCALLKLVAHLLSWCTAQALAQSERRAPGKAERQRGQLGPTSESGASQ